MVPMKVSALEDKLFMSMKDSILPEFDMEMDATRRTLERISDDKFNWKPHDKSGTLGWIAGHVATLPQWAAMTMQVDSLDLAPVGAQRKSGLAGWAAAMHRTWNAAKKSGRKGRSCGSCTRG